MTYIITMVSDIKTNEITADAGIGELNVHSKVLMFEPVDAGTKRKDLKKFVPNIKYARVISCYDGDTITIGVKNYSGQYKFPLRLHGIDTPEIRGGGDIEKAAAIIVKNKLTEKILDKIIEIRDLGYDKYGRLLGHIYFKGEHINKWLIDDKYAVEYHGGTKQKTDWSYLVL